MTLILSGTDGVSDVDGSAATPAVRGTDTNTGIFFPAADTIGFSEGGVEVARITNTAAWSFGSSGTATGTNGQVLTSAGSGAAPAWQTPTVTAPAGTTGQVQINNAGAFGAVSSGTTGQVLTSQGTGAAPVFSTPDSGAMVFLSSATASNSATVSLETGFGSTYDTYMVVLSSVKVASDSTVLGMRLRIGGSYLSDADYNSFSTQGYSNSAAFVGVADNQNTRVRLTTDQGGNSGEAANLVIYFGPTSNSTDYKQFYWTGAYSSVDGSTGQIVRNTHGGGAVRTSTAALTGVRFAADTGNIASGTFRLYGIKNS